MDFGAPVAQNVNGPQQTIQTLSGILGIRQQQAAVGTAQAQEQQQQVQAQQATGVHNFFQNFDPTQYLGSDGTIDMNKIAKSGVLAAAGTDAPDVWQKMLQVKQMQLTNQKSVADLNQSSRETLQQQIGALRTDPDVMADNQQGRAKVAATIDNFEALGPREAIVGQQYAPLVEHAPQGKLVDAISAWQMQAQSAAQQSATQAPQYFQTGPTAKQVNPQAAGGNLTGNPNIKMGIPPGYSVTTDAAGNTYMVNQQNPTETKLIWRAGQGGVNPYTQNTNQNPSQNASRGTNAPAAPLAVGQVQNEQQQGTVDQKTYASAVSAGNEAPMTKNILSNIDKLAGESITGPGSQYVASAETLLGQYVPGMQGATDEATKRQLLGKYVEQLAMRVTQANGYATDDARGMVAHAIPNPEAMTPQAIQQAARFIQAQTEIGQARSSFAQNYAQKHGSSTGFQQADAKFMTNIDPRMFDFIGLNRAQQVQKLQQTFGNDKTSEADFLRKMAYIRQLGGFDYSNQGTPGRAKGGPVSGGDYIVGEKGKEKLHLEPGSVGYVTPNPKTKGQPRWMGGMVNGGWGGGNMPPISGPFTPMPGQMPPAMNPANSPIQPLSQPPTMAQQPMTLSNLMQGNGGRYGMVR